MGAPAVIQTPTKSYVAINSMKTDRSIPPTLCDLGRVSSIAAVVTLPRTSNFVRRNSYTQNASSKPHRKRPISEVLGYSNPNTLHDNTSARVSITNQPSSMDSHANRSRTHENQSSVSASANPSTVETNPDRIHDSTSQAKRIKLESTVTALRVVSSTKASTVDNQKNISVSVPEKAQKNLSTQYHTSQSTNLPPQKLSLIPVQLPSQETKGKLHKNHHLTMHTQNTTNLPNQHTVPLLTHGIGNLPTKVPLSIGVRLQQQNQQLRNENMLLQKQLSLFRQLIQNPQRLSHVLTRLEQKDH